MSKKPGMKSKIIILMAIPVFGLACFAFQSIYERYNLYCQMDRLGQLSELSVKISNLLHETQKERGRTAGFLGSKGEKFKNELPAQRKSTDIAHHEFTAYLKAFDVSVFSKSFQSSIAQSQSMLKELDSKRSQISNMRISVQDAIGYYTNTNAALIDSVAASALETNHGQIVNRVIAYASFMQAKERAGIERAVLSNTFAADKFAEGLFEKSISLKAKQEAYLQTFSSYSTPEEAKLFKETVRGKDVDEVDRMRSIAAAKAAQGGFGIDAGEWFDRITNKINLFRKVEEALSANLQSAASLIKKRATTNLILFTVLGTVVTVCTIVFGMFMTNGIIRGITYQIDRLLEASMQVSSAAHQVSGSSQSLAEGATEQAAGLEETSSSLEEMSAMTKQNAENAQQANTLANQARTAADNGADAMNRMNASIQEIQGSSDETAKIIKVIDEIAFQTNLLALNAAVEAARAGEAGKGFAVVAEEVRNLAMRSAEAAKNTSQLIEESVKNSKKGVDIATEVGKALEEIVTGISKTSQLVGEITAASQEQAQGIEQVNTAVNQMDKVTQHNAANAEESASASEELSAQAEQMNHVVDNLRSLVGGTTKTSTINATPARSTLSQSDQPFHQITANPDTPTNQQSPEQVIPLGDNESFDNFNS